jgi:two-component system, cell cycle sensor histidine kinase and response regulator CckA
MMRKANLSKDADTFEVPDTIRVLIVDDDIVSADALMSCLRYADRAGFSMRRVDRLSAAVPLLRGGEADVLLLDLNLPDSRGLETLQTVLACGSRIPVVVLTTNEEKKEALRAVERGAQDYLVKNGLHPVAVERVLLAAVNRKRVEDTLHRVQEQLLHAQKMEGLGQLVVGIVHDFNNLLTVIRGYGKLAMEQVRPGDALRADLDEIVRASERAEALTQRLLAFGRRRRPVMSPMDVSRVVSNMEGLLRRTLGRGVELLTDLDADRAHVLGDESQLEQIVMNLAVNARDAMADGGRVTIRTLVVKLDDDCCSKRGNVRPGSYVLLSVRDTGAGIPREIQPFVFEPFFTTKAEGKGAGIGLSTVREIVDQHRGHVVLESRPDAGTEVRIYLPACESPIGRASISSESNLPRGTETILLVEDDESLRHLGRRILESLGYSVIEARNGEAALEIFASTAEQIHLVLTDFVMPRLGGPQLVAKLRERAGNFRVLYVSGFDAAPVEANVEAGASLLRKPYAPEQLAVKVRQALDAAPATVG